MLFVVANRGTTLRFFLLPMPVLRAFQRPYRQRVKEPSTENRGIEIAGNQHRVCCSSHRSTVTQGDTNEKHASQSRHETGIHWPRIDGEPVSSQAECGRLEHSRLESQSNYDFCPQKLWIPDRGDTAGPGSWLGRSVV